MMKMVSPSPLKTEDGIRIVAVSGNMDLLHENLIETAVGNIRKMGLTVSFPGDFDKIEAANITGIAKKVYDLHKAFKDPKVKAILIGLGGVNAIEILPHIDFDLIRENPKPICGFSDATIILNAIHTRTGLITYYGPMLFSFAADIEPEYTIDYFKKALFSKSPYTIIPSAKWGNYTSMQNGRINEGHHIVREGIAEGTLVGGHLPSLNLLQGTEYFPDLEDSILFIEICDRYGKDAIGKLNQYLCAILLQKNADKLKGLLVGRFFEDDRVESSDIIPFLLSHAGLKNIPILINIDFGHTTPMTTLPIGGRVSIRNGRITIIEH